MKTTSLKKCAVAVLLLVFVGTAIAEEYTPTPEELASEAANAQHREALATIANNRYGTIDGIVAMWEPTWGQREGWKTEFTAALQAAADAQLLEIQGASNYDAVRAILQGRSVPMSLNGVVSTEDQLQGKVRRTHREYLMAREVVEIDHKILRG